MMNLWAVFSFHIYYPKSSISMCYFNIFKMFKSIFLKRFWSFIFGRSLGIKDWKFSEGGVLTPDHGTAMAGLTCRGSRPAVVDRGSLS